MHFKMLHIFTDTWRARPNSGQQYGRKFAHREIKSYSFLARHKFLETESEFARQLLFESLGVSGVVSDTACYGTLELRPEIDPRKEGSLLFKGGING